ncbi:hypothetical protein BH10BAC2_BH10BAC2_00010 [soil metagenome]
MISTNAGQITSCLIDDDFIHQFGMKRMIQRYQPDLGVIEFSNGLDAINFFKQPHNEEEIPELRPLQNKALKKSIDF